MKHETIKGRSLKSGREVKYQGKMERSNQKSEHTWDMQMWTHGRGKEGGRG